MVLLSLHAEFIQYTKTKRISERQKEQESKTQLRTLESNEVRIEDNLNSVILGGQISFRDKKFNNNDHKHGPSFIGRSGYVSYRIHGESHNTRGPAIVYGHGGVEFYLNGIGLREEHWAAEVKFLKNRCVI